MNHPTSQPPAVLAVDPARVPEALRAERRWLLWRLVPQAGRWTKRPYRASDPFQLASSTDPTTWTDFDTAFAAMLASGAAGLGFALGDGWCGLDLDDARDPETGVFFPGVAELLATFGDAYCELSPSGTGLKLIFRGSGNVGGEIDYATDPPSTTPWKSGRFFTVTGRPLPDRRNPTFDGTAALAAACPPRSQDDGYSAGEAGEPVLSNEEVLRRARAAKNGVEFAALFDGGDTAKYGGDASRADMALLSMLAFWCNRNPHQIDELFRESALMRDKWDTPSYRRSSLAKAIAGAREVYTPSALVAVGGTEVARAAQAAGLTRQAAWRDIVNQERASAETADFERTPPDKNGKSKIIPTSIANVRLALFKMGYVFGRDDFADVNYLHHGDEPARQLVDADLVRLLAETEAAFSWKPSKELMADATSDLCYAAQEHSVRNYLRDLPQWDGVPRIDTWLIDHAGAEDSPYTRASSSLLLVAAVRRILTPGVKCDSMLVLVGPQGGSKSSAVQALVPRSDWFSDGISLADDAKEVVERSRGVWIAEIAELKGSNRELASIKAFLSRSVDGPVRKAYGRVSERVPRQFVCFGTCNEDAFLQDPTGNRRFLPVQVGAVNFKAIAAVRDQLWAEAMVRERAGEPLWLPEHLWPAAQAVQEEHRNRHPLEDVIEQFVETNDAPFIPNPALYSALGMVDPSNRTHQAQAVINATMQRLGFKRGRTNTTRGWMRRNAPVLQAVG